RQLLRNSEVLPDYLADPRAVRPEEILEREEVRTRVRRGVARLPEKFRAVMARHLDGMDHGQIAADLRLPIKVVYRRFHQGKAALRHILQQDGQGPGDRAVHCEVAGASPRGSLPQQ